MDTINFSSKFDNLADARKSAESYLNRCYPFAKSIKYTIAVYGAFSVYRPDKTLRYKKNMDTGKYYKLE